MAALPQDFGPEEPGRRVAGLRRMRARRGRRIWLEIVIIVLLLIGVGILVRRAASVMPVSVMEPIAELHQDLTGIGVMRPTEGIARIQQKAMVAEVKYAGAQIPVLIPTHANR